MINQISLMLQTNTNTPEIGSFLMLNIKENAEDKRREDTTFLLGLSVQ